MKNYRIPSPTLFIFILALSVACSKDDSKNSSPSTTGKWQVNTVETYGCTNTTDNKTYVCGTYTWCDILELKSGNAFTVTRVSDGANMGSGTYTLSGNILSLTYVDNPYHEASPYNSTVTISGTTMTLVYLPAVQNTTGCQTKTTYQKM
jgi:hypothetical protein